MFNASSASTCSDTPITTDDFNTTECLSSTLAQKKEDTFHWIPASLMLELSTLELWILELSLVSSVPHVTGVSDARRW